MDTENLKRCREGETYKAGSHGQKKTTHSQIIYRCPNISCKFVACTESNINKHFEAKHFIKSNETK